MDQGHKELTMKTIKENLRWVAKFRQQIADDPNNAAKVAHLNGMIESYEEDIEYDLDQIGMKREDIR